MSKKDARATATSRPGTTRFGSISTPPPRFHPWRVRKNAKEAERRKRQRDEDHLAPVPVAALLDARRGMPSIYAR